MNSINKKPGILLFGYGEYPISVMGFLSENVDFKGVVIPYNRTGPNVDMIREAAGRYGLEVYVMPSKNEIEPFIKLLQSMELDLIVVYSFTLILRENVLGLPKAGCINIHPGLLPEYRGPHILNWAIINGEEKTGVTIHYMDAGIDTGDIIARREIDIEFKDNARTVQKKLLETGKNLLAVHLNAIINGTAPRIPQDHSQAGYYPKRTPEDGFIDWSQPVKKIYNLVRALVEPWPGAYTYYKGEKLTVWKASPLMEKNCSMPPGEIAEINNEGVYVSTGQGLLVIKEAEYMGIKCDRERIADSFALREGSQLS